MLDFNPYTIVFTVINLLVLWLFLKHFLFGRVTAILDRRAQTVQSDLESAAQEKEQAGALRRQYDEQLSKTSQESAALLAQSKTQAQREYEAVLEQARAEAQALLASTRKQLEAERASMIRGARNEVAQLALLAAAKVAQKELNAQGDLALVDSFLSDLGDPS